MNITLTSILSSAPELNDIFKEEVGDGNEARMAEWTKRKALIDSVITRLEEEKRKGESVCQGFDVIRLEAMEQQIITCHWPSDFPNIPKENQFTNKELKILFWIMDELKGLIRWQERTNQDYMVMDFSLKSFIPQFKIHDIDTNLPPKVRITIEIKPKLGKYLTRAEYVSNQLLPTTLLLENMEELDVDTTNVLKECFSLMDSLD